MYNEATQAFTAQSTHFDAIDTANPVLASWRQRIRAVVDEQLPKPARILELNAGTGLDATYFASIGHTVHATDGAEGMIRVLKQKIQNHSLDGRLTCAHVPFEKIETVKGHFDLVFSNFGGLNCLKELRVVTKHLPGLLTPGGRVIWVIMPPACPWEWLWLLKGKRAAFRRFSKHGAPAHLEGHHFTTWYHSVQAIDRALGNTFHRLDAVGLGSVSPPPAATSFVSRFPQLTKFLSATELRLERSYPFNRWADHVILSYEFRP